MNTDRLRCIIEFCGQKANRPTTRGGAQADCAVSRWNTRHCARDSAKRSYSRYGVPLFMSVQGDATVTKSSSNSGAGMVNPHESTNRLGKSGNGHYGDTRTRSTGTVGARSCKTIPRTGCCGANVHAGYSGVPRQ